VDHAISFNETFSYGSYWNQLKDFCIDGYSSPNATGIDLPGVCSIEIENVRVRGFNGGKGIGIHLRTSSKPTGCYYNFLHNIFISWCNTGYKLEGTPTWYINANTFIGGWIQHITIGVNLTRSKGNIFQNVPIEHFTNGTAFWFGYDTIQNNVIGCWIENPYNCTGFYFQNSTQDPTGNIAWNPRFYLPQGSKWVDNSDYHKNVWIESDQTNGNFRIHPSCIAFDEPVGATWAFINSWYGAVNIPGSLRIENMIYWVPITHPETTGWGSSQKGRMWYCSDHNALEYWDGSSVKTISAS